MTHTWKHPIEIANTPGWEGDSGAMLSWARWSVDSLHYLADLDAAVEVKEPAGSHAWYVIDLAHARWAATSAVGAIDLCAAALSRRVGIGPQKTKRGGEREFDLLDLKIAADDGRIKGSTAGWARHVAANRDVELLIAIRHPMIHSRLKRHFDRGGEGGDRTHLIVQDGAQRIVEVSRVVMLARDTATAVVEEFFDDIVGGRL